MRTMNEGREKDVIAKTVLPWAAEMGVELDTEQLRCLGIHLDTLWEWNKRMNLTGLSSRDLVVRDLLLDSIAAVRFSPPQGRYLDIGSGGGFPAIPIKILRPELDAYLIESVQKKVIFLKEAIRLIGLGGCMVIRGRVEKHPTPLLTAGYDMVTGRAVAKMPQIIAWSAPMVKAGGVLVCFQGAECDRELLSARDAIEANGLRLENVFEYRIPGKPFPRSIVILKKET